MVTYIQLVSVTFALLGILLRSTITDWDDPSRPLFELPVLLLTAHPDDEALFFAPTVLALSDWIRKADPGPLYQGLTSDILIHDLCLSIGNSEGLGPIRFQEFVGSCQILGIENGTVVDKPYVTVELITLYLLTGCWVAQ